MATKAPYKTTFEADQVIQPIFTGGAVALDNETRVLATTLGEDAVLTDLASGKLLVKIEGVRILRNTSGIGADRKTALGWRTHINLSRYAGRGNLPLGWRADSAPSYAVWLTPRCVFTVHFYAHIRHQDISG